MFNTKIHSINPTITIHLADKKACIRNVAFWESVIDLYFMVVNSSNTTNTLNINYMIPIHVRLEKKRLVIELRNILARHNIALHSIDIRNDMYLTLKMGKSPIYSNIIHGLLCIKHNVKRWYRPYSL
jgi:hypothetical protein